MTELETHIEKKIPFVLYNSGVFKNEIEFNKELERIKTGKENFQSLRPSRNEKTN